jgi:hypothetical protein
MAGNEHSDHSGGGAADEAGQGHDRVTIHIDKDMFQVDQKVMTGTELRALPTPPIGPDRDLFEVVPGPADDLLIGDEQPVDLKDGMHFFTAPSTINPGVDAPAR